MAVPIKLHLQKDKQLEITWSDGVSSVFPIKMLRAKCPCASCTELRDSMAKTRLTVLSSTGGNSGPVVATAGQMVGNYAIRIDWSDGHGSGIYSFIYLRSLHDLTSADPAAR